MASETWVMFLKKKRKKSALGRKRLALEKTSELLINRISSVVEGK